MSPQELINRFITQYKRPFSRDTICEMTGVAKATATRQIRKLEQEGKIRCISPKEALYVYLHRYDFRVVSTHKTNWTFGLHECKKLIEIISTNQIRSIRQLAELCGKSRQWGYLYLEAMASVDVIAMDQDGYCLLRPENLRLVGSKISKGILGELRIKAGNPQKQRAPYRTKKRLAQTSEARITKITN